MTIPFHPPGFSGRRRLTWNSVEFPIDLCVLFLRAGHPQTRIPGPRRLNAACPGLAAGGLVTGPVALLQRRFPAIPVPHISCSPARFVLNLPVMRFPIRLMAVLSIFACAAFLQPDDTLRIDFPASDGTVSGIVDIRGSAAEPGMMRFRVEFGYDPDPTGTWFLIFEGTDPVRNGQLGVWDTSSISEGNYALRLAAYFADGSIRETITRGLHVRRGVPPATASTAVAVTSISPDPSAYARAAAAFPAPTAVFDAGPAASERPAPISGLAFLTGALLVLTGFGLYWIRSRWLWWSRRLFIRRIRKGKS